MMCYMHCTACDALICDAQNSVDEMVSISYVVLYCATLYLESTMHNALHIAQCTICTIGTEQWWRVVSIPNDVPTTTIRLNKPLLSMPLNPRPNFWPSLNTPHQHASGTPRKREGGDENKQSLEIVFFLLLIMISHVIHNDKYWSPPPPWHQFCSSPMWEPIFLYYG